MSTKAQVKTQAKSPAVPAAVRIPQPTAAVPEHEAERPDIAAQLEGAARLGHSLGAVGVDGAAPPIIQRQEIPEEEEEELQLKREPAAIQRQGIPEEEEEELQLKREPTTVQRQELPEEEDEELMLKREEGRVGPQGGPVPPQVEAAIRRARGGGQPLDGALEEQMSASLGHDFSRVRVHTDAEADELNQQLQATAFTTGLDIFFRRGEYNPGSGSGRELIAHELIHVVQQGRGRDRGGGMSVGCATDVAEQEANQVAAEVFSPRVQWMQRRQLLADAEGYQMRPDARRDAHELSKGGWAVRSHLYATAGAARDGRQGGGVARTLEASQITETGRGVTTTLTNIQRAIKGMYVGIAGEPEKKGTDVSKRVLVDIVLDEGTAGEHVFLKRFVSAWMKKRPTWPEAKQPYILKTTGGLKNVYDRNGRVVDHKGNMWEEASVEDFGAEQEDGPLEKTREGEVRVERHDRRVVVEDNPGIAGLVSGSAGGKPLFAPPAELHAKFELHAIDLMNSKVHGSTKYEVNIEIPNVAALPA